MLFVCWVISFNHFLIELNFCYHIMRACSPIAGIHTESKKKCIFTILLSLRVAAFNVYKMFFMLDFRLVYGC